MYWLILLGVLGQSPGTTHLRTMAEVRQSLNRIDDLSFTALEVLSYRISKEKKDLDNNTRFQNVRTTLYSFAENKLNIQPPMDDIEKVIIEDLAKKSAAVYDKDETPTPVKPKPKPKPKPTVNIKPKAEPVLPTKTREWIHTREYGNVWGWMNADGTSSFYKSEQPIDRQGQITYVQQQLQPPVQYIYEQTPTVFREPQPQPQHFLQQRPSSFSLPMSSGGCANGQCGTR